MRGSTVRNAFRKFPADRRGATAVEYALILVVLSLVIMGGVGRVANDLTYLWGNNASRLNSAWTKPD